MKIIRAASELNPGPAGVSVAIGVFDGVHLGHQAIIGQACDDARKNGAQSVVITFDRHPNAVVAPKNVPLLIYPLQARLAAIESLGVDVTFLIHFDKKFSEIPGEEFIRGLARDFGAIRGISVGETFMFGCHRSGNVELLKSLQGELGYTLRALPDISLDGQPVSSTRIRETIRAGQLDAAGMLLGRPYTLCGEVVAGARIGRTLGFPTANLNTAGIVVPPAGVYAANALVDEKVRRAAVNIGHRPTMYSSAGGLSVEAHLLDFNGDLYGQEIELTFLKKLRDERKFPSPRALQEQIERDVAATRAL
jgi:riboflavin kinase/FMN adenylyltransferase